MLGTKASTKSSKKLSAKTLIALLTGMLLSVVVMAGSQYQKPGAKITLVQAAMLVEEAQVLPVEFKVPATTGLIEIKLSNADGVAVLDQPQRWVFQGDNLKPVIKLPLTLQQPRGLLSFYIQAWENTPSGLSEAQIRAQVTPVSRVLTLAVHNAETQTRSARPAKPSAHTNTAIKVLPNGSRRHLLPASSAQK